MADSDGGALNVKDPGTHGPHRAQFVAGHEFLEKPLGQKSHRLLHTTYQDQKRLVKHAMKEIWQEIENRT